MIDGLRFRTGGVAPTVGDPGDGRILRRMTLTPPNRPIRLLRGMRRGTWPTNAGLLSVSGVRRFKYGIPPQSPTGLLGSYSKPLDGFAMKRRTRDRMARVASQID